MTRVASVFPALTIGLMALVACSPTVKTGEEMVCGNRSYALGTGDAHSPWIMVNGSWVSCNGERDDWSTCCEAVDKCLAKAAEDADHDHAGQGQL